MKPREITYGGGHDTPYSAFAILIIILAFAATISMNGFGAYKENEAVDPFIIFNFTLPADLALGIASVIAGIAGMAFSLGYAAALGAGKQKKARIAFLCMLVLSGYSALNTYTLKLSTIFSAEDTVKVEAEQDQVRGAKLTAAQTRVDNATAEVARLESVVTDARSERDIQRRTGEGPKWKEAVARMQEAEAELVTARAKLSEAEEAQVTLLSSGEVDAEGKTEGAAIVANQSSAEAFVRILLWVLAFELFNFLPAALRRDEDEDQTNMQAWMLDQMSEIRRGQEAIAHDRSLPEREAPQRNPIAAWASGATRQAHEVHDEFQQEFEEASEMEPPEDDTVMTVRGTPSLVRAPKTQPKLGVVK